ncbi:MAG TPA: hypothetical protein PKY08_00125 [Candidatus Magasanikbacteria bacterium]|nr:hypothetical protein [Candidatus Magasanikbacteria bacterium]
MNKKFFKKHKSVLITVLVYLILGLALYSSVLNSFFVSDDFDWLSRAKFTPHTFSDYFLKNCNGGTVGGVFRPLTQLSYLVDFSIAGLSPWFFHLTNILFFIGTALIIYWLIFLISQKHWLAFWSGLFFLVLPNHPEAVTWISGRGDVLAAFFYILSLVGYVKFRQKNKWLWLAMAVFSFFLSTLSKEMGMSLPGVLLVYEILFIGDSKKNGWRGVLKRILYLVPFVAILALYLFLRWNSTHILAGFYASADLKPSPAHLIRTLFLIIDSNFIDGYNRSLLANFLMRWPVFLCLVGSGFLIVGLILKKYRQEKIALLGLIILLIGALPVLPLSFILNTSEGERFAYLPSMGLAIILGWLSYKIITWPKTKYLQFFPPLILMLFLSSSLIQKNWRWQEAGSLSHNLIFDFGQKVDLQKKQGIVILTLPDNVYGAQVLRNGWFAALKLYYPTYIPNLLVARPRLLVTDTGRAVWLAKNDSFVAKGTEKIFYGASQLESLDYIMQIGGYDKTISSGDSLEIIFTPTFLKQMETNTIIYLAPLGDSFKVLNLKEGKK